MFADVTPASQKPHPSEIEADAIRDVEQGKFDILFPSASVKLADLYRETQKPAPPQPTAKLRSQLPIMPEIIVDPDYPRLAKMTHTEGDVTFAFEVDSNGVPTGINVVAGHPLLQAAVKDAVAKWRFSTMAAGQKIQATIQFATNCLNENPLGG
jgi:TonB family protein